MKKRFFHNFRLKALALTFSFALWFFVAGQSSTEVGFMIPLVFKDIPDNMVMTSIPPVEVEVRALGPNFVVKNLRTNELKAEIDLGNVKEGINNLMITPADIAVPAGVKVTKVIPATFDARMESVTEMDIPVRVRTEGSLSEGYRIVSLSVSPRTVQASVVASKADKILQLYTKPVDVNGLGATKVVLAQLDVSEREFRSVSVYNVKVKITVEKEKQGEIEKKTLRH